MMNHILCVKYGNKYNSSYVNTLYNMVQRNCTVPYQFNCLTEDPSLLNENINVIHLPTNYKTWWNKLYMFSKDLPIKGNILYLDLDVIISNNIDRLFSYNTNNWCIIRDFNKVRIHNWTKYNSSVIRFNSGELNFIWDSFLKESDLVQRKMHGDQDYIHSVTKKYPAMFWPDEWILSWKWQVRKEYAYKILPDKTKTFLNIDNSIPPKNCCICIFHGYPNPDYCEDPWVKENWK